MTQNQPLISVIVPAYNEAALLADNVGQICAYMTTLEDEYRWELLIVNDGSSDGTREIADQLATANPNVLALHHPTNLGLGQTLKFGFANCSGDYVASLDVDLSYDVQHIGELITTLRDSSAKIVLASPYMQGGTIRNVPWLRRTLSILGNKFLSVFSKGRFSTLTSIMRVYDGPFIRSLDMRSMGMDIMPEMLYKAMVVHAKIEEAPGRLDWGPQLQYGPNRTSSLRIARHVGSTVLSGFVFRPFLFFVVPGIAIGMFALYVDVWMFLHFFAAIDQLQSTGQPNNWSAAFAVAYKNNPHTFVTAFLSSMLALQLIGLGIIALQNMRYFEDLYHQNSNRLHDLKRSARK